MDNELPIYYFHQGTNYEAYSFLGCNASKDSKNKYEFRVWSPNAISVYLISDFTGWSTPVPLERITDGGIWELVYYTDKDIEGMAYKYKIVSNGKSQNKGDPYAKLSRGGADGASIVYTKGDYEWNDSNWLEKRRKDSISQGGSYLPIPINIYEVHLGSFMRKGDGSYFSYTEMADILLSYAKAMGYTHIELMPITEYPYDGSWGYQVGAFFAITSRFGTPRDFKYFVNRLHESGIGVIVDWVPAHFPKDEWGLYEFDGQPLYEYQGKDRQESKLWGTRFFDVGRNEVQSFLISSALYFLREFHIDGLRVDAVASMLYLDYDRLPGEWIPNIEGGNVNLEAVAFFKKLNTAVFGEFSDVLMIAEESTSIGNVTTPVSLGGLGFNLKWNMGWANDLYDYISLDPVKRAEKHCALTFPIMYAFTENFCLPISHDEVVHGKRSLIDKIYGSYSEKFSTMRAVLLFMMTFPGKKLLFMGTEFAQFREWDFQNSLEWFMLDYDMHNDMREYVRSLNHFYLSRPELWNRDFIPSGFSWIAPDEKEKNIIVYRRISSDDSSVIVAINFSGTQQCIKVKLDKSKYIEILFKTEPYYEADEIKVENNGEDYYVNLNLSPLYGLVFREKNGKYVINKTGENNVL